jgi:hypothetical protein
MNQLSFSLPFETLQSLTELLCDADAMLTDGDTLQKLRTEWGDDSSTYLWTRKARALLKEMKQNIKPLTLNP